MDIYSILASKPHNPHYLNRYITFIEKCQQHNNCEGYYENHHICPKAKDMFPEYENFSYHKWNSVFLTARQHYIAHMMLMKVFPNIASQVYALWYIMGKHDFRNSKMYEAAKIKISKLQSEKLKGDSNPNIKRMAEGTHHFLSSEYQSDLQQKRIKEGTHNLLGGEMQRKMVADGTHNLLSGEIQRKQQNKLIEEGNHNFKSKIPCRDRQGNKLMIDKEIYDKEIHLPLKDREYVHVSSKEAKIRRRAFSL